MKMIYFLKIFMIILGILIYLMRGIVGDISLITDKLGSIIENMESCRPTSGIV